MKRNAPEGLSLVAGIRDHGGGFRLVVTDSIENLMPHVGPGERAFVHPDILVREPITIQEAAEIIPVVEAYMREQESRDERSRSRHRRRRAG